MQVADRFLQSMQPRQKLQVLVVAMDLMPGKKKALILERLASPINSTLESMKPSEVTALCQVMARVARDGVPMDAELATAVALHMWSGKSGIPNQQREVLLNMLKEGYNLPIQVQMNGRATVWGKVSV
jgi:hypothetical protein